MLMSQSSVLLFCLLLHSVYAIDTFTLPEVKYADLVTLDESSLDHAVQALLDTGIIQISGIPRFGMIRKRALEDLAECFEAEETVASVKMTDGSHRVSSGAASRRGVAGEMSHVCGEAANKLRAAVDATTSQLFLALDSVVNKREKANAKSEDAMPVMKPHYETFRDLMSAGEHLEHLHTYFAPNGAAGTDTSAGMNVNPMTLDYHMDAGLMIAMTTGYYVNGEASEKSGLYLELEDGKRVKTVCADDSLIILMGDGAARWLNPVLGKHFHAAKHALIADLPVGGGASRSWYGKMYLPPADAIIPQEQMSFQDYHAIQSTHSAMSSESAEMKTDKIGALQSMLPSACGGNTNHYITLQDENCPSGQIWCWARCMDVPAGCTASDALCIDTQDGSVWTGGMCMGNDGKAFCEPECFVTPTITDDDNYCNGEGVSMFMEGFVSIAEKGKGETGCVNLFFTEWTLDTPVKYAIACIGIFCMGIFIQFLAKQRIVITKVMPDSLVRKSLIVLIYGAHVTFGYFAMLAAMTYSVELFCMVICGLTVGFAMFHLDSPNSVKSTDPCCPDVLDDEDSQHNDDKERILQKGGTVINGSNYSSSGN
jgi:hypothetical protein